VNVCGNCSKRVGRYYGPTVVINKHRNKSTKLHRRACD